jgi:uncharacterized membrane protein
MGIEHSHRISDTSRDFRDNMNQDFDRNNRRSHDNDKNDKRIHEHQRIDRDSMDHRMSMHQYSREHANFNDNETATQTTNTTKIILIIIAIILIAVFIYFNYLRYMFIGKTVDKGDIQSTALLFTPELAASVASILYGK